MNDLYIYYKVRSENAALLYPLVREMHGALGAGQLKRRHGEKEGLQTWMEIYTGTDDGFQAELDEAVRHAGIGKYIEGERHTEIFTDLF